MIDLWKIISLGSQPFNKKFIEISYKFCHWLLHSFKISWEKLSNLRSIPVCNRQIHCAYTITNASRKYQEEGKIIRFLKWLNECFNVVKSHTLSMNLLPQLNKVFVLLLQYERNLNNLVQYYKSNIICINKTYNI